jgi:hypothetical protein
MALEPPVVYEPSRLRTDARVRFSGRAGPVTLLQVKPGPFWDFVYRDATGALAEVTDPPDAACPVSLKSAA